MYKKFLAFIAAVAMFSACGSQDVPEVPPAPLPDYSEGKLIDREPNNDTASAVYIDSVGNIKTGFTFTGSLKTESEIGDDGDVISVTMDVDYYKLKLKKQDSLSITVLNSDSPFRFRFFGPCYDLNNKKSECVDTTVIVKNKTVSFQQPRLKSGHENPGVDLAGAEVEFYIKVFNSLEDFNQSEFLSSNRYLITVKLYRD